MLPYVPSGHSSAVSVTTFSAVVTIAAGPATNAANGDTRLPTFGQAVIFDPTRALPAFRHMLCLRMVSPCYCKPRNGYAQVYAMRVGAVRLPSGHWHQ